MVADDELAVAKAHVTVPPGGLHLAALSSRFATARSSRSGTPCTTRRLERDVEGDAGRLPPGTLDCALDELVERGLRRALDRLAPARELDDVAHQHGQLVACSTTSCEELAALRGEQLALRESTSRFVRRLVSGVRSSCDASATSWRCAATDRSSASSVELN